MVQIIEEGPSFLDSVFGGAARGAGQASGMVPQFQKQKQLQQEADKENQYLKKLGIDLEGASPETRRLAIGSMLKSGGESDDFSELDYESVKNIAGKEFADVYKVASKGGKTALMKSWLDSKQRNIDLFNPGNKKNNDEVSFDGSEEEEVTPNGVEFEEDLEEEVTPAPKKTSKEKWPDFTKPEAGYTPKEWAKERSGWRKENLPFFKKNVEMIKGGKQDRADFKRLGHINEKMPDDASRILINPKTGELYGAAQLANYASPEVQEFAKIIARFQNRAKDAFGSRVTNFDLQSYMKQFPSLLNTQEGRRRILDLLQKNSEISEVYDKELDKIYKKYGLHNIPYEKADELVIQRQGDKINNLLKEYSEIDKSPVWKDVIGPDGEVWEVNVLKMDKLPEGYRYK
jgi:hypothetical protein